MSLYGCTLPPFLRILASSSGSSPLWSLLSGIATRDSFYPTVRTNTARESPTFAQKTFVPTMSTETQVEPENRRLIFESL